MNRPTSTRDLRRSERRFAVGMNKLEFGRYERVRIEGGELVLDPWPTAVRGVRFGAAAPSKSLPGEHELAAQVAEFFGYVRSVESGEIRCLEVRHGLPFSMEIDDLPSAAGGRRA